MMNVIEIDHLTYSYPGAEQPTLKGITVKIKKGDFLAIVGNNGCGKSTFCKTLNGLIPQFISGDFQGYCIYLVLRFNPFKINNDKITQTIRITTPIKT